jgi:hypothetical protein
MMGKTPIPRWVLIMMLAASLVGSYYLILDLWGD